MKLSIVIPVYNERRWLEPFWNRMRTAPIERCRGVDGVEIVVVDDGSTDGTAEELARFCDRPFAFDCGMTAKIQFIGVPGNKGKGYALRQGIARTTGDVVIIQDADLEYSAGDYPVLLQPFSDHAADVVFGSRFVGHPRRVLYFWHSVMNKCLTLLFNALNDVNLTDMETGYKVVRGEILRKLRLTSDRFGIEPELASRVARAKCRLYEVPVSYHGRTYGEGKKIKPTDGIAALFHIFRFGFFDREPFNPGLSQTLTMLDDAANAIYVPLLKRALAEARLSRENPRILEVGAGIGTLTDELLRRGSVVATDISPELVGTVRERFRNSVNLDARVWDASTPPWENAGRFDLIVAFNVLEHIEDDRAALEKWWNLLAEDGVLIVLVPQYQGLYSAIDKAVGHFRRYSRRDLVGKVESQGFRQTTVFHGNGLGILGWLLFSRLLGRETLPRGPVGFYALFKPVFRVIEILIERFGGLSLIAVARRASAATGPSRDLERRTA